MSRGRALCRLRVVGYAWVGDDEIEGALDFHWGVPVNGLGHLALDAGDVEEVFERHLVVAAELDQRS